MSTLGPFIETYWRGITILHSHHQLVCGLKQGGETMKKNILLRGIIDGMKSRMLFHTMMQFILLMKLIKIMRVKHFLQCVSGGVYQHIDNIMMIHRPARYGVIVRIMDMMIMIIGPVPHIKVGRTAVKGIMTMDDRVMIQTTTEAVGETGESVNLGTVNGTREALVGKRTRARIGDMSILLHGLALVLMVVMIGQGQGLLEAGVMVEVIGKTVMMTAAMTEVIGEEIVMIDVSMTIILLYAPFTHVGFPLFFLYLINGLDHCAISLQAPSATVVVKGLSQKTSEEDLYQILAEWGPLHHVRVIKERNSGISRGFAFIDFPSVDSAQAMMDKLGHEGLLVDGRKLFFEYSSKPTGGANGSLGMDSASRSGHGNHRSIMVPSDWMCTICGCVNFARRTSCFQCNEPRTEDAPPADMASSNPTPSGKRGEAGPTHVLVVRGLDENADEEMLRYEFSKHAPIKDLRLVRDKFTHVSRGFAFVHFYSVEDATKALEATNGTNLEKNGQILRVAYAKSIVGPGSAASGASQSSSLAAAAIEAATFAQQLLLVNLMQLDKLYSTDYDAVGWAPKEYNPEDKQSGAVQEQSGQVAGQSDPSAPQSGFVWDEASGYYYDAASGFYYDGNTGLYYDGNNGLWYSFDQQTQQYIPCTDQNDKTAEKQNETSKPLDGSNSRKVVISAPAATVTSNEKAASLPDAVQAAAAAAIAAEKKEKEKLKEIRLASKSSILANKKKMNNVLTMWKQRSHEGQAPRISLDDNQLSASVEERSTPSSMKSKFKNEGLTTKENAIASVGSISASQSTGLESQDRARPVIASSGGTLKGVIRGSGMGVVKSDTVYTGPGEGASALSFSTSSAGSSSLTYTEASTTATPFRTDASALGSYIPPVAAGTGKRRFSEMPSTSVANKEQSQPTYRDRAAERRSLYGSSSAFGDDLSNAGSGDPNRDPTLRRGVLDSMPFPPGVGGGRSTGDAIVRGLGKDGSGMVEPVQAQAIETRAGLGSHQPKKVDPSLEVQAGDSYKAVIQKKAIARFREMS
ncbi:UNVERIFIED_CONTAM: suppressor of abi3-5 [Sesamum radiatum]|uniref:Suppressor of abi3-5 n=1 Tax=Sesamum radiatum TaxID=300843 RepID=A0AAW2JSC1_SESRA